MAADFKNPYISRVTIKNFRNFLKTDVTLDHKQVIIGENNVGKTNFLRAIQLILDKDFSDNDRQLTEEDFHDSIESPMVNGETIEINLYIRGHEHNRKLVAQFADAVLSTAPPTLKFTYKYFPNKDEHGNILNYLYEIYKGVGEEKRFTNEDRSYINIYVIKALRDVERELKGSKHSALYKLVKQYEIAPEQLEKISDELKAAADGILELDEIIHIRETITDRFASLSGLQTDHEITLRTFDIDTERLLYTLQVYMGIKERPVAELSLGLANILYVSLMLILLKDRTVMPVIKADKYAELLKEDEDKLLPACYDVSNNDNYILKKNLGGNMAEKLYRFMDENNYRHQAFTILAVEEPEAHLHPVLQRLIYREVLHNSNTSVIFTSHSTFIASVTPLQSIVHIRRVNKASKVFSTANLVIDKGEKEDIERYVDAKRGEIYFGKGIILAEGISEEYFIPAAATVLKTPLDDYGIIVCDINSTNFKPYVQLLNALNIPWVIFTDGDYYREETTPATASTKEKTTREYHVMDDGDDDIHLNGYNIAVKLLKDLKLEPEEALAVEMPDQEALFIKHGIFVGYYTLEVDIMNQTDEEGKDVIKETYKKLHTGGVLKQLNFERVLDEKKYWSVLQKIEDNAGKGRFAQRLSSKLIVSLVPGYIKLGIDKMVESVKKAYE